MNATLEWKIANLPESPGCYLMKHEGEIIYVGKAKNLKNRVSQYFHYSRAHTPKGRAMVEKIVIDDEEPVQAVCLGNEHSGSRVIYRPGDEIPLYDGPSDAIPREGVNG